MKIRTYIIFIPFIFSLLYLSCATNGNSSDMYGPVKPGDYLTGKFYPSKHELFVALSEYGIPANKSQHFLRREAARALKEMYAAFRRDHPEAPFWVQSSTRNYFDQKYIWEGKWIGKIQVMGKDLSRSIRDPLARAVEILKYSSMPGASRHHWGTDFDLNALSNSYYESGEGKVLYRWLVKNAQQYGFCQPYTAGRDRGHSEERWHWSYLPLAGIFLAEWNLHYKNNSRTFSETGRFSGSPDAGSLAPEYMNAINQDCKE